MQLQQHTMWIEQQGEIFWCMPCGNKEKSLMTSEPCTTDKIVTSSGGRSTHKGSQSSVSLSLSQSKPSCCASTVLAPYRTRLSILFLFLSSLQGQGSVIVVLVVSSIVTLTPTQGKTNQYMPYLLKFLQNL